MREHEHSNPNSHVYHHHYKIGHNIDFDQWRTETEFIDGTD